MKSLREVWAWDGMDYVLQIGLILCFAFGASYALNANQTLTEQGCTAYWEEYNPGVNLSEVVLVDSKQANYMKSGKWGDYNLNYKNQSINYSDIPR